MIRTILFLMFFYTVLGTGVFLYKFNANTAVSFCFGGLSMLINTAGLVWVCTLIFRKKTIALAIMVIILKYVFLALVFWALMSLGWLNSAAFVMGLGALIFATFFSLALKPFLKLRV